MSEPKLLDLDALVPSKIPTLKHKGESHEFRPITVEDWLANLKDVRELGEFMDRHDITPDAVAAAQMRVTIASLHRSYPSISIAEFGSMDMTKLDAIVKFTRALDGSDKVEEAMKAEASANPPLPATPEPTQA